MNIKKDNENKKTFGKKMTEFLGKKGFYVVLLLCIAIVGAGAVIITTNKIISTTDFDIKKIIPEEVNTNTQPKDKEDNANKPEATNSSGISTDKEQKDSSKPTSAPVDKGNDNTKKEPANNTEKPKENVKLQQFIAPVSGDILCEYSSNKLVYSKTLDEWRTHRGVDIGGDRGTLVKAVADGIVSEIRNDSGLGLTVVIEHAGNVKTMYSNLASDDMVLTNQKVKQGEPIGCIGNTAKIEALDKEHLHFEVLVKNGSVDPKGYLPAELYKK